MIRYCDKCKEKAWPKTSPSYMGWYKCAVCGEITFCHMTDRNLEKQVEQARKTYLELNNEDPEEPKSEEQTDHKQLSAPAQPRHKIIMNPRYKNKD